MLCQNFYSINPTEIVFFIYLYFYKHLFILLYFLSCKYLCMLGVSISFFSEVKSVMCNCS